MLVTESVDRDATHPAGGIVVAADLVPVQVGFDERVLDGVGGDVTVAGHDGECTYETFVVGIEQRFEVVRSETCGAHLTRCLLGGWGRVGFECAHRGRHVRASVAATSPAQRPVAFVWVWHHRCTLRNRGFVGRSADAPVRPATQMPARETTGAGQHISVDPHPESAVVDADLDPRIVVVALEVDPHSIPRLVLDLGTESGGGRDRVQGERRSTPRDVDRAACRGVRRRERRRQAARDGRGGCVVDGGGCVVNGRGGSVVDGGGGSVVDGGRGCVVDGGGGCVVDGGGDLAGRGHVDRRWGRWWGVVGSGGCEAGGADREADDGGGDDAEARCQETGRSGG